MVSNEDFDKLVERTAKLENLVDSLIKWTHYDYKTFAQKIAANSVSHDKSNDDEGFDKDKQPLAVMTTVVEERPACPNLDELNNDSDMNCILKDDDESDGDLENFFRKWTRNDCMPAVNATNPASHNKKSKDRGHPCDLVKKLPNVVEERQPVLVCPNFNEEAPPVDIDNTSDDQVGAVEIGDLKVLKVDEHGQNILHQVDNDGQSDVKDEDDIMDFDVQPDNKDVEEIEDDDGGVDNLDSDFIPSSEDEDDENGNIGVQKDGNLSIAGKKGRPKVKSTRSSGRRCSFPCKKCGKVFSQKAGLTAHDKAVHLGRKEFSCPQCSKKYSSEGNLGRHIKEVHSGARRAAGLYPCPKCHQILSVKSAHIKRGSCPV